MDPLTPTAATVQKQNNIARYIVILAIFWTAAIGLSLGFGISSAYHNAEESARIQARTAFEKDLIYRRWNSNMGGVYAKISEQAKPNPYLTTPLRDVTTLDGMELTLINPAYMTRLVHELGQADSGVRGHITSNNPIRKGNEPDAWEGAALSKLENHEVEEVSNIEIMDGQPYMRLIRPLMTEESCMACHAFQGYQVGMLRGGISVSVPMQPFQTAAASTVQTLLLSHGLLWLLGIYAVTFFGLRLKTNIQERDNALEALSQKTTDLITRTEDLDRSQRNLRSFMNNTDSGLFLKDLQGRYLLVNKRFASLFSLTPEDMIGKTDREVLGDRLDTELTLSEKQAVLEGEKRQVDNIFHLPNDETFYSGFIFPVFSNDMRVEGVGGIVVDVSQQKRMEKALVEAKEAAECANRAKSDFLANISHEIRTPLNGVIGMADLLLRTELTTDQASMAATIKTGGDSLLGVLNDVLDFSKIEAGKLQIEAIPFSLRDVVFDAVKGQAPIAHKKGLELIVHIAQPVPDHLIADYARLRQILLNLLGNAIKFTEKGEISIMLKLLAIDNGTCTIRFSVADTGIGIPASKQETIFSAFEQADSSTTRRYGGTGLGLAISYKLADLMGGKLCVERYPGCGSTFWFDLTLPYLTDLAPRYPQVSTEDMKGLRALIVDDNATNRHVFTEQLGSWGMTSQEVESVDEALQMLIAARRSPQPFNIVLSDYQMPGRDGLDFINTVRATPELKELPILLLSSANIPPNAFKPSPIQAHLSKPARPEELMRNMAMVLGLKERLDLNRLQMDAAEDAKRTSTQSLRVLLAEDMEMNQYVATRMLNDLGHEVVVVSDGEKAVSTLQEEHFDIVFMDIQMPVMDGLEATRRIRENEKRYFSERTPIVAMTANALKGDKEKYLAKDMDAYIAKPILLKPLVELIETLIAEFNLPRTQAKTFHKLTAAEEYVSETDLNAFNHEPLFEVLDPTVMESSFGNNPALIEQSIAIYLRDAPKLATEMVSAVERDDNGMLVSTAHALKGITSYYTRGALYETCMALEQMGRTNALPAQRKEVESCMSTFETLLQTLIDEMRTYTNPSTSD